VTLKCNAFINALQSHTLLMDRIQHSTDFLKQVRDKAAEELQLENEWDYVSVFAAGSLGRFETGRKSDLDVFLLGRDKEDSHLTDRPISRLDEIRLLSKLININASLKLPQFSGDGSYLKVHSVKRIVSSTGDANDDSENLFTTRLLLLLESKAIWNDKLRENAIESVLANYFKDGKGKKDFRPLFLLNDILRYWRTLCLNYERDRVTSRRWWKKNLNLKFSRKLTVFSTVLAILTRYVSTEIEFKAVIERVPLERLALSLDALGDMSFIDRFKLFLDDYESFLAAKSFAELEEPVDEKKQEFKVKAERFAAFLDDVLMSARIDGGLRRYLLI
jgi:predicted nucleotidyltransferase